MCPRSCFSPLLSPSPPPPHPAHTRFLGCGDGPGLKNVEEKERNSCLAFSFSSGLYRSCGEFSCFCCAKPESHLLQCRCGSMFPLAVTLCHPRTSTLSPTFSPTVDIQRWLRRQRTRTPDYAGSVVVFSSCKRLNISQVARRQGGEFLAKGALKKRGLKDECDNSFFVFFYKSEAVTRFVCAGGDGAALALEQRGGPGLPCPFESPLY